MITTTLAMLDLAELMQLAVHASAADESGSAIAYLKEAVSRTDATGMAHYLLGAEYAQIGMYERAAGELEAALALEPGLALARLQLGLLWITRGMAEHGAQVLAPLEELAPSEPLHQFGKGLRHLILNELDACRTSLLSGIELNGGNSALNGDMQKIVVRLDAAAAAGPAPLAAGAPEDGEAARHIMLSAYTGNTSH